MQTNTNETKNEMSTELPIVLNIEAVGKRYSVGKNNAIEIIKRIKWFVGNGGALPAGRVLRTECEAWEEWMGQQRNPKVLAQMEKAKQTGEMQ